MSRKIPLTTRFDSAKLATAESMGIDLTKYFRDKLDEILGNKVCPTCGKGLRRSSKKRKVSEYEDLL